MILFQTLYFPTGFFIGRRFTSFKVCGVVDHQRAVLLPDRHQGVAPVLGELDVRGGLARFRAHRLRHLQRALVDELHGVLVGAHHRVHPRIGCGLVAAHEERGAERWNFLHDLPALHVDHAHDTLLQVRRRQHPHALALPGDARAQMWQTGQRHVRDLAPHVEIHHLPLAARARGTDNVRVTRIEEEIVEHFGKRRAARVELARQRDPLAEFVIVDEAVVDRRGVVVVGDLPDLGNVLQRRDEALARCRVVHRRHARALALLVVAPRSP